MLGRSPDVSRDLGTPPALEPPIISPLDQQPQISISAKECVMLVLTRKQKETIKIGDSITVTILRVQGHAVRVGIEAPRDVRVVRGELAASKPGDAEEAPASEPQIIEFRFSPGKAESEAVAKPAPARGPLSSLMATLHLPGQVSNAVAK